MMLGSLLMFHRVTLTLITYDLILMYGVCVFAKSSACSLLYYNILVCSGSPDNGSVASEEPQLRTLHT